MNIAWLGQSSAHVTDVGDGHRLHEDIIGPFTAMQKAAARDNIDCQLVSGFRDFERQLAIWNKKWRGDLPLLDYDGQPLNSHQLSDYERMHAILTWSALPGGSRHHWGTDIDVYDKQNVIRHDHKFALVDSEYRAQGPCAALSQWLDVHAREYGFERPYLTYTGGVACELWHLSHQPTAARFEAARDCQQLAVLLSQSQIEGKEIVIKHIETLYEQYVLNKGKTS